MSKIAFIIYVLITSTALITLKLSTASGAPIAFTDGEVLFNINIYTILGVFLYGFSFLTYLYLLSKFSLGYVVPITTSLVYVLVFVASFVIFKEAFTSLKIVGIVLVLVGFIFLNSKK